MTTTTGPDSTAQPTSAARLRLLVRGLVRRFQLAERADVACCGVTVAQAATLEALAEDGPLRLGELGTRLGIAPSTLTRNLGRLEERGLVRRVEDPSDRRTSRVGLTAAGRDAAAEVERQEERFAASILALLPGGRGEDVVAALEDLLGAVREATQRCCPGAFDHLMTGPGFSGPDRGENHDRP